MYREVVRRYLGAAQHAGVRVTAAISDDESFERLVGMQPVTIATLPRNAPKECVYLFSEQCRFSKPRDPFLTTFSKPFPPHPTTQYKLPLRDAASEGEESS
jgi:hypothetical protein